MKYIKIIFLLAYVFLCCFSCEGILEEKLFPKYEGVVRSVEWTPTDQNFVYEIDPSIGTLKIDGKAQSQVYFVRLNPSYLSIPNWQTRYVTFSAGQRQAIDSKDILRVPNQLIPSSPEFVPVDYAPARDFVPPALNLPPARSAYIGEESYSSWEKEYELEDRRYLYTDDENTREWATLKFKGNHCNIWVVDGYYTTEDVSYGSMKVNDDSLLHLGTKFDTAYPIVHTLFGEEQDYILDWYGKEIPINKKINIVVYDINKDRLNGGTVGFFWGKDFYTSNVLPSSNQGKFFYLDANWVCNNLNLSTSTLVHEFQHMINYSKKPGSATWFSEMLAMLCEEALQECLVVEDNGTPRNRLSLFCEEYWRGGITTWESEDALLSSYSRVFAFGAFLLRNYGGISLLQNIASNPYVNQRAIEEGLKDSGINKSFEQVFTDFVFSLIMNDGSSSLSLNRSVEETINGYQFSLPAINLNAYYTGWTYGVQETGPVVFDAGINGQMELHPYGFSLHKIGSTSEDGSLTINFSDAYLTREKNYILVK